MIKSTCWIVGLSLLLTLAGDLTAQGGVNTNAMIAGAADADRSGDVTAAEWQAFILQVDADGDGNIDPQTLKALLLSPGLDRDRNGTVEIEDLIQLFRSLDQNTNSSLQPFELSGGGRGGGRGGRGGGRRGGRGNASSSVARSVVLEAADADGDGTVTIEEWDAILVTADPDGTGNLQITALMVWIQTAETTVSENRNSGLGVNLMTMGANLDADRNGTMTVADLNQAFAALDGNGDLALQADEVRPQFARGGRGGGGRGGRGARGGGGGGGLGFRTPTDEDRTNPPLMPFQRSLEDALALVEATGKPLLIVVNMDAEPASESLAAIRYRSPEWVEAASGFIPLLASPDRRNLRDHDDRGRRIVDEKFGRLINAEHIDIEPALYERYFQGQRVAPRHLAVDKDGNILFDIYLTNELTIIDAALEEHGVRGTTLPPAESLDEASLLASPDAGHREYLEQRFVTSDEATRVRTAGLALSSERSTQHPEILRMALLDPARAVRLQAVTNMVENSARAPLEFYPIAFRISDGDETTTSALLGTLAGKADSLEDEALVNRAQRLRRSFSGLAQLSELLDVARWRLELESSPAVTEPPLTLEEVEGLDRQLDELGRQRQQNPDDAEVSARVAALTMRYGRIRILTGQDPTFLFEDVRGAADRASSQAPHGEAEGYGAWAAYMLGDSEDALVRATKALPNLLDQATTALTAEVLNAFAMSRTQALYAAMGEGTEWPASWVSDIKAAYDILVDHPHSTEEQLIAAANWFVAMEGYSDEARVIRRGLDRFPLNGDLHQRLREQQLRDADAQALESAYAAMSPSSENASTVTWFAGLASIVAAERQVTNKHPEEAIAAYSRSVDKFRESVVMSPGFQASSAHYICLGLAGRGRLHIDAGQLDRAVEDLQGAIAENPASATWEDGMGNSPAETATELFQALTRQGRDTDANALRDAYAEHGVQIGAGERP